jgi:hypothetical protein
MPTDPGRLDALRRWARLFDSAFRIPGTQITFGLDPILGLVPGIGDLASPVLSLFFIWHGVVLGVPKVVLTRMVLNVLIDSGVGAIPVVGDVFDVAWKANDWNLSLLERHVRLEPRAPGQVRPTSGDYLFVIACALVVVFAALLPILLLWLSLSWLRRSFTQ